jgi:hypothetical protein
MKHSHLVLGALLAALAPSCVRGPQVRAQPSLGLRRVVVYRNGVAYFERAGRVAGDQVEFSVRQREVGDFLATLAVMERGGSSVRSAAFPLAPEAAEPGGRASPDARRAVRMTLDGHGHDLVVGYMAETPIWRPTYRLVMGSRDVQLQAWGVVQNLSGEDWSDVQLSLVTGAPVSFRSELAEPILVERPLVTDRGEVLDAVPQGDTTLAQRPASGESPAPMPPSAPSAQAYEFDDEELEGSMSGGSGSASNSRRARPGRPAAPSGGAASRSVTELRQRAVMRARAAEMSRGEAPRSITPSERFEGPSRPRSVASLAAVAVQGGSSRYDIPQRVTVPDRSATMVLLSSRDLPGERLYLFAPDAGVGDSARHPFNVARFVNRSGASLERGPLAIFEAGAFLGQGMLDPLPPDATAVVPFALERGLAVDSSSTSDVEGARLLSIRRGVVHIERYRSMRTTYRARNGMDRPARLLVRVATPEGSTLFQPPPGTEATHGASLVPIQLAAQGRAEQLVVVRSPFTFTTEWSDRDAIAAIRAYIQGGRAPRPVIDALTAALELQEQIARLSLERGELATRQRDLQTNAQETRDNLESIRRNPAAADLRERLTQRLTQVSAEIDQVNRRIVELDTQIGERRVRMSEAIRTLEVDATATSPAGR